jgi:hypothetical protein
MAPINPAIPADGTTEQAVVLDANGNPITETPETPETDETPEIGDATGKTEKVPTNEKGTFSVDVDDPDLHFAGGINSFRDLPKGLHEAIVSDCRTMINSRDKKVLVLDCTATDPISGKEIIGYATVSASGRKKVNALRVGSRIKIEARKAKITDKDTGVVSKPKWATFDGLTA